MSLSGIRMTYKVYQINHDYEATECICRRPQLQKSLSLKIFPGPKSNSPGFGLKQNPNPKSYLYVHTGGEPGEDMISGTFQRRPITRKPAEQW